MRLPEGWRGTSAFVNATYNPRNLRTAWLINLVLLVALLASRPAVRKCWVAARRWCRCQPFVQGLCAEGLLADRQKGDEDAATPWVLLPVICTSLASLTPHTPRVAEAFSGSRGALTGRVWSSFSPL